MEIVLYVNINNCIPSCVLSGATHVLNNDTERILSFPSLQCVFLLTPLHHRLLSYWIESVLESSAILTQLTTSERELKLDSLCVHIPCNHDFYVTVALYGPKLDWASFGKTLFIWHKLFSCTSNTPPLSLSVTMNKLVNRIFQSSCGVLLSEWTTFQKYRLPVLPLSWRLLLIRWKIAMIPVVAGEVSAYQQHGFHWH